MEAFIQEFARPTEMAILKNPAKKSKAPKPQEATRRSRRLAEKAQKRSHRKAEAMAQEVLCKKLVGELNLPGKEDKAHSRLIKLFDAHLPEEAIEAIEELLKVISLENKRGGAAKEV
jgi:hypothetical protein